MTIQTMEKIEVDNSIKPNLSHQLVKHYIIRRIFYSMIVNHPRLKSRGFSIPKLLLVDLLPEKEKHNL